MGFGCDQLNFVNEKIGRLSVSLTLRFEKKKQIRQGSDNKRCFAGLILATKYDRPERQNEVTNLGKL